MEDHAGRLDRGADGEFPGGAWSLVRAGRALWCEDGHRGRGGGSVEGRREGRGRKGREEGVREEGRKEGRR